MDIPGNRARNRYARIKLSRPDTQKYVCLLISARSIHVCVRNKAVADGAISYYLDHFVVDRIAW